MSKRGSKKKWISMGYGRYRSQTTSSHSKTKLVELIERINDELTKLDFNGSCEYIKTNYKIKEEYRASFRQEDVIYSLTVDTLIEINILGDYNKVKLKLIKRFSWDAGKYENRNVMPTKSGKSELELMLDALGDVERNKFHFNEMTNFFKTNYPNLKEQKPILCDKEYFGQVGCQNVLILVGNRDNKKIEIKVQLDFDWGID